jgi:hypothetical protein
MARHLCGQLDQCRVLLFNDNISIAEAKLVEYILDFLKKLLALLLLCLTLSFLTVL